jgi:hypothetical protein
MKWCCCFRFAGAVEKPLLESERDAQKRKEAQTKAGLAAAIKNGQENLDKVTGVRPSAQKHAADGGWISFGW